MSKPIKSANNATKPTPKPTPKATAKVTKLTPKPQADKAKAPTVAPTLSPTTATPQTFPLGQLIHGENSRKHYAQRDIEERAASIKSSGLLQNLVGYLEGDKIAISAGHTRLKALLHLVATKAEGFTLDYPVPVLLKPKAEALADSLIENLQRRDLAPLEESQAFGQLLERGMSPEEISARTGKPLSAVQKRLRLLSLTPEVQKLLEDETLTLVPAQALTVLSSANQEKFLEVHGPDFHPELVEHLVSNRGFLVQYARFPLERYTGQGGIIHEDLFGNVEAYFDDKELAATLQLEALAQLKAELLQRWSWVEVVNNTWLSRWDYLETKDPAVGGAVLLHHPETHEVTLHEGLLKRQQASNSTSSNASTPAQPKPKPTITKSGTERTKTAKTRALQTALIRHPQAFKHALAINVMGLLGVEAIRLGFQDQHKGLPHDPKTFSSPLGIAFENLAPLLDFEHRAGDRLKARRYADGGATLLETLLNLPVETLHQLFVTLTACAIGSWGGYHQNDPSDSPLTLSLAKGLEARVPQSEVTDEWLKGLSKSRLEAIYAEIAGPLGASMSGKDLRKLLLERLKLSPDYLPRELTFHGKRAPEGLPDQTRPAPEEAPEEAPGEEDLENAA